MTTRPASRIRLLTGTVLALGLAAACAVTPTTTPAAPAPASSAMPATSAPASSAAAPSTSSASPAALRTADATALALKMADTSLGSIVVDGKGMTLYMFAKDTPGVSACEGQCLVNWPPLLGRPTRGAGVDDSKLGSFVRKDGQTQATYNGWPLYYWVKDVKPGDTTGQNVQTVWFVLNRDGAPIKA